MERTEQVWFKLAYSESPISFRQQGATPHSKNNNKKINDLFSLSRWCKQKTDALQNNNFGGLWNNFDTFVQASDESRLPGSDELSNRVMIFEHIVQLLSLISLSVLSALIICTLIFFFLSFPLICCPHSYSGQCSCTLVLEESESPATLFYIGGVCRWFSLTAVHFSCNHPEKHSSKDKGVRQLRRDK